MIGFLPVIGIALLFFPFRNSQGQKTNTFDVVFGPFQAMGPFMYEFNNKNNSKFDTLFIQYGAQYGIDPKILKSMAIQESSLNPNAKALTSTAYGLMQMTVAACNDVGESYAAQRIPDVAIRSGAKYLKMLMNNNGFTLNEAIQAYYAGAGTILRAKQGQDFNLGWQADAYKFATNTYQPKITTRAQTLTLQG